MRASPSACTSFHICPNNLEKPLYFLYSAALQCILINCIVLSSFGKKYQRNGFINIRLTIIPKVCSKTSDRKTVTMD